MLGIARTRDVETALTQVLAKLRAESKAEHEETLREIDSRLKRLGEPPSVRDLAQEALREIMTSVNPKEFLENLLITRGLTLEGLVRKAVTESIRDQAFTTKDDVREDIVEKVADRAWDELDLDRVYEETAKKLVEAVLRDYRDELMTKVSEEIATRITDDDDHIDAIVRITGEKAVEALREK